MPYTRRGRAGGHLTASMTLCLLPARAGPCLLLKRSPRLHVCAGLQADATGSALTRAFFYFYFLNPFQALVKPAAPRSAVLCVSGGTRQFGNKGPLLGRVEQGAFVARRMCSCHLCALRRNTPFIGSLLALPRRAALASWGFFVSLTTRSWAMVLIKLAPVILPAAKGICSYA